MMDEFQAKAVQKARPTKACPGPSTGAVLSQRRLRDAQENMQHRVHCAGFAPALYQLYIAVNFHQTEAVVRERLTERVVELVL